MANTATRDFRAEEERLRRFVADEEAADTLRWVCGELGSLYGLGAALVNVDVLAAVEHQHLQALDADPEFQPLLRGTIALMAANELAKHDGDPSRAHDLIDVAFLDVKRFSNVLRKRGIVLYAFQEEDSEERRQRRLRAIRSLRAALSDRDWSALEHARMRDLR